MQNFAKFFVSLIIFIIGFLFAGLFPGLLGAVLFVSALIAIGAIWRKRRIQGEGDIFKNEHSLKKD